MNLKRLAVVVAGVAAALSVGAGVASAEYGPPGLTLALDPATVAPGGTVVASSRTTCVDGVTVDLVIEPAGDATTAICVDNSFAGRLTAPSNPGTYEVTASAGRQGVIAEATLTVRAEFGGPEQPLPSTGPDGAVPIAVIGAVLVVGGGAMRGLGQLRRRRLDRPSLSA